MRKEHLLAIAGMALLVMGLLLLAVAYFSTTQKATFSEGGVQASGSTYAPTVPGNASEADDIEPTLGAEQYPREIKRAVQTAL